MTLGWKIFIVSSFGLGLVPFTLMKAAEVVGLYDPENPRGGLVKQFSPIHNMGICLIFIFFMAHVFGLKS